MGYTLSRSTATRVKRLTGRVETSGVGGSVRRNIQPSSTDALYFVLAEDIASTSQEDVYVWISKVETSAILRDDTFEEPVKLININYVLSPVGKLARAGFAGVMISDPSGTLDASDNVRYTPIATYGCLTSCVTAEGADLPTPEFTDATVDEAYTFTLDVTGEVTTIVVENLPDGLTFDDDTLEITGTPTEAGSKWVTVTGTSGTCTVTKLAKMTVLEAE